MAGCLWGWLEFMQSPAVLVLAMAVAPVGLVIALRRRLGKWLRYALMIAWTAVSCLLLAGISIGAWEAPLVTRYDQSPYCLQNLREIKAGKARWASENRKTAGTLADYAAINRLLTNSRAPFCPSGGIYSYNLVGTDPTCSLGVYGHNLNPARGEQESHARTRRANNRLLGLMWLVGCLAALMLPRSVLLWGLPRRPPLRAP